MKCQHELPCPCTSGRLYFVCCLPYLQGLKPKDALALMRSRYTAYAQGNAEYIIRTTHKNNPAYKEDKKLWKKEILDFSSRTSFTGLEIGHFVHGAEVAYVTFTARLRCQGKETVFKEKSRFEKRENLWLYHSALIS